MNVEGFLEARWMVLWRPPSMPAPTLIAGTLRLVPHCRDPNVRQLIVVNNDSMYFGLCCRWPIAMVTHE